MPALPGTIGLTNIPDGASIVAADHRNNYVAIQAAVNALIALFSNGSVDGDPMVWDGILSKWVAASTLAAGRPRAPRVVTSAWAGGPPASPVDQDIWIATGLDVNGTRGGFQYNAGSASPYKWEWIGGSAITLPNGNLNAVVNGGTNLGSGYFGLAGSTLYTPARAGDYRIRGYLGAFANGAVNAGDVIVNAVANSALVAGLGSDERVAATGFDQFPFVIDFLCQANAAASSLGVGMNTPNNATWKFSLAALNVTPTRIA